MIKLKKFQSFWRKVLNFLESFADIGVQHRQATQGSNRKLEQQPAAPLLGLGATDIENEFYRADDGHQRY